MFVNKYSWKCLLGPQSKEATDHGGVYTWKVGKKNHFMADRNFIEKDIEILKNICPSNFNYLSNENILFLKKYFNVAKSRVNSVLIGLENFSLNGSKYKKVRQAVSKAERMPIVVENNFRKLKDVEDLIEDWSTNYTDKYFRDFSGKNYFFYKNNFHKDCINVFIYLEDELMAYGSMSPNNNGKGSYIVGKALYKKVPGVSEYADVYLFEKAIEQGIKNIDMGAAPKNLLKYKMKYPNSSIEVTYDGKILNLIE